jgi:hypothetical protein
MLETIVPALIIICRMPAYATGTPNSRRIAGHPAPSIASGNPRLMNEA